MDLNWLCWDIQPSICMNVSIGCVDQIACKIARWKFCFPEIYFTLFEIVLCFMSLLSNLFDFLIHWESSKYKGDSVQILSKFKTKFLYWNSKLNPKRQWMTFDFSVNMWYYRRNVGKCSGCIVVKFVLT